MRSRAIPATAALVRRDRDRHDDVALAPSTLHVRRQFVDRSTAPVLPAALRTVPSDVAGLVRKHLATAGRAALEQRPTPWLRRVVAGLSNDDLARHLCRDPEARSEFRPRRRWLLVRGGDELFVSIRLLVGRHTGRVPSPTSAPCFGGCGACVGAAAVGAAVAAGAGFVSGGLACSGSPAGP